MNEEIIKLFLALGVYPILVVVGLVVVAPFIIGLIDRPKHRSSISHRIRR